MQIVKQGDALQKPCTAAGGRRKHRAGQSQPGRHAAMPVSRRTETGAHCISRCGWCGSRTKSTPPARPMAAGRWQQSTVTPGGSRGSGASLEVNVRSWWSWTACRTVVSPEIRSGMGTPSRRRSDRRCSSCKLFFSPRNRRAISALGPGLPLPDRKA